MEKDFENIDAVIAKFLAGETSPGETALLEDWKNESQANTIYFEESKKIFATLENSGTGHKVDVDAAWNKLNEKISGSPKIIPMVQRATFLRVAASLLLLIALGFVMTFLFNTPTPESLIVKATSVSVEKTLPDGSKVFVHKNSEISYQQNKKGEREVFLKGEAFFEVVHDEKKPFVVNISDVRVQDIGTGFNIKENQNNNTIEVLVESGEVHFYSETNAGLNLVKGEKAIYDKTTRQFTKVEPDPSENTTSYKSRIFEFKETPLKEVIAQLNDVYGCNIRLSDNTLADHPLVVVFNNEDIDEIVKIIAETLDLEVEKTGDAILLKNKSVSNQ